MDMGTALVANPAPIIVRRARYAAESAMRPVQSWLAEYGESHRHPANDRLHRLCVPAIMLSLVMLFASIPRPAAVAAEPMLLSWGTVLVALALAYYFVLAPRLALGMTVVGALLVFATWGLARLPWPLAASGGALFVAAWIGQFVGHAIEGRRPSFFRDLQFLLIGPLWLLARVYRAMHITC